MAEHLTDSFLGKGIIVRAEGGVSFLGDKSKPMQITVNAEDIVRMGADAVITTSFPGSKFENEILSNLTRVCMDMHRWGVPVVAEALPRGFEPAEYSITQEKLNFACRQSL